jgi:hypothetical protein
LFDTGFLIAATAVVVPRSAVATTGVAAAVDADVEGIAVRARHTHGLAGNLRAFRLGAEAKVNAQTRVATVGNARGGTGFAERGNDIAEHIAIAFAGVGDGYAVAVANRRHATSAAARVAVAIPGRRKTDGCGVALKA